jgi:DNA-binding MarR family transcriptional regulator
MTRDLNEQQKQAISELGRKFSDATVFLHEAIAQKAGLTSADRKYLGLLMQKAAMTAGDLSKLTGLTTGAVTGLIDRLEKKKLARRQFDKTDRRKIIIVPNTANAVKLFGASQALLQTKINTMISGFSDNEITVIEKYLLQAIEVMNEVSETLKNK